MPDIFELMNRFCPDGVPYYRLDQVFDILQGYSPSMDKKEYWEGGTVPFFRMENLKGDGCKLVASDTDMFCTMDSIRGKPFPGGSLIMATCATIGVHALVCEDFLANQQFSVLKPAVFEPKIAGSRLKIANEPLDMDFANYYAFELDKWCKDHINEGTFAQVNMVGFRAFPWPVPPLQVQREIVAILDKFDAYCNNMTAGLAGELEMRRKQYRYWAEHLVMDGNVEMVELDKLCRINKGTQMNKSDYQDGPYPIYNMGAEPSGTHTEYNRDIPSIVIAGHGNSCGFVNWVDEPFWAGGGCYYLDSLAPDLSNRYLYHAMKVREGFLMGLGSHGPIRNLYPRTIARLQVPVPVSVPGTGAWDIARQQSICDTLDKFLTLEHELEYELEYELELRRKQYEYYRDMLLSFPERKENA